MLPVKVPVLVACIATAAAARPNAAVPAPGIFTTDDTSYVAARQSASGPNWPARYGFTLVARYHNPTKAPIYLARCFPASKNPSYGVQLVEASRSGRSAYSPVWACVGHDKQIVVAPGATRVDTLEISGPATWSGLTKKAIGVLQGRFRLAYGPQGCPGDGKCEIVADSLRYSNEFTVHLAQ